MRMIAIVAHSDGRFEIRRMDAGIAATALTTTDPDHLGRTVTLWATAQRGDPAAIFAAANAALPPLERSYTNSRADQEGIATRSKWPAAALKPWPTLERKGQP